MAGASGFSTKPMGFDKNEVNEYISNLSNRMSELDSDKKELEKKYAAAKKIADEADDKIRKSESEAREKEEALEAQIRSERQRADGLIDQIDDLKRKLKQRAPAAGGANTADAEKKAAEIIAAANKKAQETVAAANKKAQETVAAANKTAKDTIERAKQASAAASAQSAASPAAVDTGAFMAALRDFMDSINSGCKLLTEKAEEIGNGAATAVVTAPTVEIPDFVPAQAPAAEEPVFVEEPAPIVEEPVSNSDMDEMNALLGAMAGGDDMFGGSSGGSDDDMGGGMDDMFSLGGFENPDTSASMDDDFSRELITDTVPVSELENAADDLIAAALEKDESLAVKPAESSDDFDMGAGSSFDDEMQKLLEQAASEIGGSSEFEEKTAGALEPENSDPWSDLQSLVDEARVAEEPADMPGGMDTDMGADIDMSAGADDDMMGGAEEDIWSLGDTDMGDGGSDDDMSMDLFGSF